VDDISEFSIRQEEEDSTYQRSKEDSQDSENETGGVRFCKMSPLDVLKCDYCPSRQPDGQDQQDDAEGWKSEEREQVEYGGEYVEDEADYRIGSGCISGGMDWVWLHHPVVPCGSVL